jgi:hypothetical protein
MCFPRVFCSLFCTRSALLDCKPVQFVDHRIVQPLSGVDIFETFLETSRSLHGVELLVVWLAPRGLLVSMRRSYSAVPTHPVLAMGCAMRCGVAQGNVVRCGAVRCGIVWCGAMRGNVAR